MAEISFQDIKKAYASKAKTCETTLCYSGKEVYIRPIKMKDKKEFLKVIEVDNDDLIDKFIDNLIEKYVCDKSDEPLNPAMLVDQERHQLLMLIRKHSTEHDSANINHICPKCRTVNTDVIFDFKNISIKSYKKPEGNDFVECRNGAVKFLLGLPTRADVIETEKYIKDSNVEAKVEKEFIYIASTIKEIQISIDDVVRKYTPKIKEKVEFVENLTFDDFEKIKNYLESHETFGLSLSFNFACKSCDYKNEKEEAKIVNFFIR